MDSEILDLIRPYTGPIGEIRPAGGGFSNATTAILTTGNGMDVFVKAVPDRPGGRLDEVLREAEMTRHSHGLSPELLWQTRGHGWVVLVFAAVEGRHADFEPGSSDLPLLSEMVNKIADLPVPEVASTWVESRWDPFIPVEDRPLLQDTVLTHTDLHERNVLITAEQRVWVVDWSWPTLASCVVTPSCMAVQLLSAGHTLSTVEAWVTQVKGWKDNDRASRVFARANAALHLSLAARWPDEAWLGSMAVAAQTWASYVDS